VPGRSFQTGVGGGPGSGTSHASNPALSSNKEIGKPVTGPGACADITAMLDAIANYNAGKLVPYSFNPNGVTTWNSNSFTYTLLNDVGLLSTFPGFQNTGWIFNVPIPYPGYGMTVPGLVP